MAETNCQHNGAAGIALSRDILRIVNAVLTKSGCETLGDIDIPDMTLDKVIDIAIGKKRKPIPPGKYSRARGSPKYESIKSLINISPKDNYPILDFGCGDCSLIHYMESIGYSNLYGADIWNDNEGERLKIENFGYITKARGRPVIPFKRKKFRYIFCLMVLHHIPECEISATLRVLHRRLERGGYLIVREHNCINDKIKNCVYAEHFAHADIVRSVIAGRRVEISPFEHCQVYYSTDKWIETIKNCKFRYIFSTEPKTDTQKNYIMFQRRD